MSDDKKVEEMQSFDETGKLIGSKRIIRNPEERPIHVSIEGGKAEVERLKKETEKLKSERDEAKRIVNELAQKTYEEFKEKVKSKVSESYHSRIDDMSPDELEGFVSGLKEHKKASVGSTSLHSGTDSDIIDKLLEREFDTQKEMVQAVYKLYMNPDLTSSQKRRLKQAKDKLWSMLKDQSTIPKTITRKTKYDGKHVYLVKCYVCHQEIPQDEYYEHFNAHVEKHKDKGAK